MTTTTATATLRCIFCGPVRNCGPYLEAVFRNVLRLGQDVFDDAFKIVLCVDPSNDNTHDVLRQWQARLGQERLHILVQPRLMSPYRTHRIAAARNRCLYYIRRHAATTPYFIMMDWDNPNATPTAQLNVDLLRRCLMPDVASQWDGLCFQTAPHFYDIWALSLYPYGFSYNHFPWRGSNTYAAIQTYVERRLAMVRHATAATAIPLLACMSAFNGFAIYRTDVYALDATGVYYDGRVRLDLVPPFQREAHASMAGVERDRISYRQFGHIDGRHEDCEHRAFHYMAHWRHGARLRICAEILFRHEAPY